MLNIQYYKHEIQNLLAYYGMDMVTVKNGRPVNLFDYKCKDCDFRDNCNRKTMSECRLYFFDWLVSEYHEPEVDWEKIPIDTLVLVSNDNETWFLRRFAGYASGKVSTFIHGRDCKHESETRVWKHAMIYKEGA